MAFGKHWEWRGFGTVSAELHARIEALPLLHPDAQVVTDTYLWLPGCAVNVKLRFGDLKLKRLISKDAGLEEWLEDPGENFPFPLDRTAQERLTESLTVEQFWTSVPELTRDDLLRALPGSEVTTIAVEKSRRQYRLTLPALTAAPVTVELVAIAAPEAVVSIGLEHPQRESVASALHELGVPGSMRSVSYLDALAVWAHGQTL